MYERKREEVFGTWSAGIARLAKRDNVVVKVGGFSLPDNGWGFHERPAPPTSDELSTLQGPYYPHVIVCFGPRRCMFESNFPVDRVSVSYAVLFNAMTKVVADLSAEDRHDLFYGTAERVYHL